MYQDDRAVYRLNDKTAESVSRFGQGIKVELCQSVWVWPNKHLNRTTFLLNGFIKSYKAKMSALYSDLERSSGVKYE